MQILKRTSSLFAACAEFLQGGGDAAMLRRLRNAEAQCLRDLLGFLKWLRGNDDSHSGKQHVEVTSETKQIHLEIITSACFLVVFILGP